ncbi:hypothetical protein [Bradyrhizobium genosp. P]|uniref:hypothetical protein n=1 Tax=Bradyrhizobium genosp. P TaxID=83641 RepID=UPI003CF35BC4
MNDEQHPARDRTKAIVEDLEFCAQANLWRDTPRHIRDGHSDKLAVIGFEYAHVISRVAGEKGKRSHHCSTLTFFARRLSLFSA